MSGSAQYSNDGALIRTPDGFVVPVGKKRISAQGIIEQLKDVLSTEYTGEDIRKLGMTKGEAALLNIAEKAQNGDLESVRYLHDRLMGKPTQTNLNLGVTADLKSFLGLLAEEVVDTQVSESTESSESTKSTESSESTKSTELNLSGVFDE